MLDEYNYRFINKKGQIVKLTENETYFLEMLIDNKGKVVRYDEMGDYIYGQYGCTRQTLQHILLKVKKKLGQDIRIHTIRGLGYMIK